MFQVSDRLKNVKVSASAAMTRKVRDLRAEGVTAAELSKARNKLETRFYQGLQTAQQRANSLGFWEVTGGDFKGLFNQSPRYAAVCVEDVRRVASDILRPENRTVVVGRPLTA